MYVPRHWHFAGPVAVILTGFGLNQYFYGGGVHVDTWLIEVWLCGVAYHWGAYIHEAGAAYQHYLAGIDGKDITYKPTVPYTDRSSSVTVSTGLVLNQVTTMPKFNAERNFYKTLIDQRNHNFKIETTETFWITTGRYGESREKFAAMKERGVRLHALCRKGNGNNAKYLPDDWRVIRLLAQGEKLSD